MDLFKGILVQVISNGQILESYDDPDTNDDEDPYQRQRYIEAVTGATFAVKVIITDQFDLCHISRKDGIIVKLSVDGFYWGAGYHQTRERLEEGFQKGKPCTYHFDDFTHFSEKTGRWMKSEYSFGALKLNESTCVDSLPAQVQDLGKIEISLQRARLRPSEPSRKKMIPVKTIMEVPERALKGKAVQNTVKLTEGVPAKAPQGHGSATSSTISGPKGLPLVHRILYRSRHALQMLGCIPPDPSSAAITILEDEEQDSTSGASSINANAVGTQELQQQVQSLRAQLTLLERSLNVKSEAPEANTRDTSQRPQNIKREREEDENAASRQRRRKVAKVETIDSLMTDCSHLLAAYLLPILRCHRWL